MAVVINEMEVVPVPSTPAPASAPDGPAVKAGVRLADLARAERRLRERAARVHAH